MRALFENPIMLLIIIGIISSLFNRVKNNQSEDGKRRTPSTRQVQSVPVGHKVQRKKQVENQNNRTQSRSDKNVYTKPTMNEKMPQQRYQQTRKLDEEKRKVFPDNPQTAVNGDFFEKEPLTKQHSLQIDQAKLVDGLIWSEILGPPRSKKSHRSIK